MKNKIHSFLGYILLILFVFEGQIPLSAQRVYPIPQRFDECPKPPLTDYSKDENWASLPTKNDPADKTPEGVLENQKNAKVDVFYIHPTTFRNKPSGVYAWNADVNDQELNQQTDESPLQYQASIFNGHCKVYAARYRQAHFYCFRTTNLDDKWKSLDYAYTDIKNAFEYYLKHYNNGRPIVIAAHSQGTIHAHRILQDYFQDSLKNKLVIAYLVGMPVPKDSLPTIDFCKTPNQSHCWVSWSSYERNFVPQNYHMALERAMCVNPLTWKYDEEYAQKTLNQGAVLIPFKKVLKERCDAQVHGGILWVTKPKFKGSIFYTNPNYHIADFNFYYMDIRQNLELRIQNYFKEN